MNLEKMKKDELYELLHYSRISELIEELTVLFCNSVIIDGLPDHVPQHFVTRTLLRWGRVVVPKKHYPALTHDEEWVIGIPVSGLNRYGDPDQYQLRFANQTSIADGVPYEDVHVIKANAIAYPWIYHFAHDAEEINRLELSAMVNVEASRNTKIIPVENESARVQIESYYQNARNGAPVMVLPKKIAELVGEAIDTDTPFIADKIDALCAKRWEEACKRCGIVTANGFKRERVQAAEVNAGAGESIDYIYTMIDTFNRDCERAGLAARMRFNGYADTFDTSDVNNEEVYINE